MSCFYIKNQYCINNFRVCHRCVFSLSVSLLLSLLDPLSKYGAAALCVGDFCRSSDNVRICFWTHSGKNIRVYAGDDYFSSLPSKYIQSHIQIHIHIHMNIHIRIHT